MSDEMWAEIEAKEVRLWVGEPVTGLWCPTCLLPSGYKAPISRDPAEPSDTWMSGCVTDKTHEVERNG
jgi:hypothetical protein